MATGNPVLPGAPVTTDRAVIAEQHMTTRQGMTDAGRSADPLGYSPDPRDESERDEPTRQGSRGAGGRWLIWVLRGVLWIVLLLIGYRGVVAIFTDSSAPARSASTPVSAAPDGFPVSLASAFALEFGQVYLNFSPATAAERAAELTPFLPAGTNPQLGWNGSGSQSVQSVQVAGVDVQSASSATVRLLALANGHLIELAVPVYYSAGGLVVSGQPALLPPPGLATPPPAPKIASDKSAAQGLTAALPAFFSAFASGDSAKLGPFAAPGVTLSGLNGEVAFGRIASVSVPASHNAIRAISVTVSWLPVSTPAAGPQSAGGGRAQLDMTYSMTVEQRAGRWLVRSIGPQQPSTPTAGSSS